MDDQTKYMEINTGRNNETSNNVKWIVRVFTSREFGGKLSNNGLFSPSWSRRAQMYKRM